MASKRKAFLSRSVSLSLAALIVLTGAMFLITTLEQDHQEWVLVEDQVVDFVGLNHNDSFPNGIYDDASVFDFDEETSTYTLSVTAVEKSSSQADRYFFSCLDNFDYSEKYKIAMVSVLPFNAFSFRDSVTFTQIFSLKSVPVSDEGTYNGSVILYDQYVTDLSFKDAFIISCSSNVSGTSQSTFGANDLIFQIYTLEDDNAGSIAAAITGLTLIVMGVFATPMLNVFRRR